MLMKNFYNFLLLVICTYFVGYIYVNLLQVEKLTISTLGEQFTLESINKVIEFKNKIKILNYFITPIVLIVKLSIIVFILDVGLFFYEKNISKKKLLSFVIKAEYIFLIPLIFKTIWFYFFQQDYSLEDIQYFYPLSALNIIGYQDLQTWFIYPFQTLNLFELTYWFILAYLIGKELNISNDKSLSIVVSSYGVSLLIWVAGVMFFTLNMS